MREILINNIWSLYNPTSIDRVYIGITTNGTVRKDDSLVMGRGIALQATQRIEGIAKRLAHHVKLNGNTILMMHDVKLFSFPVKHHWHDKADLNLIKDSAHKLKDLITEDITYYLPRPGCGNGRLIWSEVKPILESVKLPDNVIIFSGY